MIKGQDLSFSYAQKSVLHGLSFEIERGDFCAFVGPNGSGKTTLLKLIAGLLKPQGGEIRIDGQPLAQLSPMQRARLMAYVPQQQDVVFDFSVFDTILMGRNPYQNRWENASAHDREIAEQVLHQTGLEPLRDRMLTQLSGGEVQRVMIARAIAQQTPVILLDEPLSNLDVAHEFEVMDLLQQLHSQQNTTIIIILHDFSFVKNFSTRTLMLQAGEMLHFGNTRDVLTTDNLRAAFRLSSDFILDENGHIVRQAV